jgi:hypothetical protein
MLHVAYTVAAAQYLLKSLYLCIKNTFPTISTDASLGKAASSKVGDDSFFL